MCKIDWVGDPKDSFKVIFQIYFVFFFTRNSKILIMAAPFSTYNRNIIKAKVDHIHPEYSAKSGQNDIAVIVTDPLEFNDFIIPACLWYNTTHLPFNLSKFVFDDEGMLLLRWSGQISMCAF
jgi:hypothetical protein